ncbi:hypothetical protein DRQ09_03165 [candidate division KSB1 bacterium]|nr:MAG: hypothetical protein DRQ09_03165 [candidate division KSB1 bacterium]
MKFFFIFLILLFLHQNQDGNYIREAEKLIENNQLREAVKKLEKIIENDRKNPEAFYLLGETYRRLGTLNDRLNSSRALKEALKLDPENTKYLLSYGLLKKRQGFKAEAEYTFKKIVKIDSTFSEAYHQLGLMHYKKAIKYRDMVSAGGLISMSEFGIEENEKARNYFKKALQYNKKNDEILFHLGLLYLDDRNWNKMAELFKKAIKLNPENKQAHLFLGYALQKLGEFKESEVEYKIAKKLMSKDELNALESINILLNDSERENLIFAGENAGELYWKQRTPSFLEGYNERKIEHYSRFAYVNLRFGDPEKGLTGWKTDRGEVFLRYGEPLKVTRTRAEVKSPSVEIWDYGSVSFVFEDEFMNGNYRLTDDSKLTLESVRNEVTEFFVSSFDKRKIGFFRLFSTSRGQKGKTNLDIFFEIPVDSSIIDNLDENFQFFIDRGVFIFDDRWNKISEKRGSESFYLDSWKITEGYASAITSVRMVLDSGLYNVVGEFQDWKRLISGSFKEKVRMPDYSSRDYLAMSDLILGVQPENYLKEFNSDLDFFPRPSLIFDRKKPIELYFEVYNLMIGAENKTKFNLKSSITLIPEKTNIFNKILGKMWNIIRKDKRKISLTNTFNFEGKDRTEKIYLSFFVDELIPGKYLFSIELTDNFSNRSVSKSRKIILF